MPYGRSMNSTLALVSEWISEQRWFAGKGRRPLLRLLGEWELPGVTEHGVHASSLLVMDDAPEPAVLYQIPVVRRPSPLFGSRVIGQLHSGEFLIDGVHDPVWTYALISMILGERDAIPLGVAATGRHSPADVGRPIPRPEDVTAHVLAGEQSNTSIIFEFATGVPVIAKVYRQLHHGDNPDVVLQSALAEAGSPHVPLSVGDIRGEWDDVGRASGRADGHLVFAQEFLDGAPDAWRVALVAAESKVDFVDSARSLGATTALVHQTLARVMPTRRLDVVDLEERAALWARRLDACVAEVPALDEYRAGIERVHAAAVRVPWCDLQRIHGDYHLGQVLFAPDRGWVLLDFEGEPLRPMFERDQPDLVHRDVAGMLRSFDYVAGSLSLTSASHSAPHLWQWASRARKAFLDGYIRVSGNDLRANRVLLDAFELDKAIYEAVYEHRNRPDWESIPLGGVARLLSHGRISVPRT